MDFFSFLPHACVAKVMILMKKLATIAIMRMTVSKTGPNKSSTVSKRQKKIKTCETQGIDEYLMQ